MKRKKQGSEVFSTNLDDRADSVELTAGILRADFAPNDAQLNFSEK